MLKMFLDTNTCMRHRWHFAQKYARHRSSNASVHRCHELSTLATAFVPKFCSRVGSDLCCWGA